MDELINWLRSEMARGHRDCSGDPWDAGWYGAVEAAIRRISDFPDPPPIEPEPSLDPKKHRAAWDMWEHDMAVWCARNADSADEGTKP